MNYLRVYWRQLLVVLLLSYGIPVGARAATTNVTFVKGLSSNEVIYLTQCVVGTTGTYDIVEYEIVLSNAVDETVILEETLYSDESDPDLSDIPKDLAVYDVLRYSTNLFILYRTDWIKISEVTEGQSNEWSILSSTNVAEYGGSLTTFPTDAVLSTNISGELEALWLLPDTGSTNVWLLQNGVWLEQ